MRLFTHSSRIFSHILAGGAEKSVLKGWQDSGETFQKWTRTGFQTFMKQSALV